MRLSTFLQIELSLNRELFGIVVDERHYRFKMRTSRLEIGDAGVTSVFEATPAHFKLLAQNQLGQEALASPAICSDRIYLRHATTGESRQEYLWCIGQAAEPRKTALLGP